MPRAPRASSSSSKKKAAAKAASAAAAKKQAVTKKKAASTSRAAEPVKKSAKAAKGGKAAAKAQKSATKSQKATAKTPKTQSAPPARRAVTKKVEATKNVATKKVEAAKKAEPKKAAARKSAVKHPDAKFLEEQRALLVAERTEYENQAETLRAEAEELAAEMEPGDSQFDEENGGEGDTLSIERERDLALVAQAKAAMEEIDRALGKIDAGNYGICERCHQPIMRARLKALPHAALCVACKSGGLSRR